MLHNVVLVNNNRFARPNQSLSSTWISSICINFQYNLFVFTGSSDWRGWRTVLPQSSYYYYFFIPLIFMTWKTANLDFLYSRWPETRCNFTPQVCARAYLAHAVCYTMFYNTSYDLIIEFADDDIYARYVLWSETDWTNDFLWALMYIIQ